MEKVYEYSLKILEKKPKLSDNQKKAVFSNERYLRVIAGAGAGKTETLARRIAYLLLVENIKPSEIVTFTFTEQAARSMKDRIYAAIEEIAGPEHTKDLGEMFIGTIHGFALRLIEEKFDKGHYAVLDDNQEVAFVMRYGFSLNISEFDKNYPTSVLTFIRTINMIWDEMIDEDTLKENAPEFFASKSKYEKLLEKHHLLTFGLMVNMVVRELRKNSSPVSYIKHLLVDEYQDINKAQEELIDIIGKFANLFVVGDPRQTIYQWRGSNRKFFENFMQKYPGAQSINIRENNRSVLSILKNANKFTECFDGEKFEMMEATRKDNGAVCVTKCDTEESEARWIINQIKNLVSKYKIKYKDIGILTRSVNTSGGILIDMLKQHRIPYIVAGKVGLFRRDEAQALGRIFAWFYPNGFWYDSHLKKVNGDHLLIDGIKLWCSALGTKSTMVEPMEIKKGLEKIKEAILTSRSTYTTFTEVYHDVLKLLGFHLLDPDDEVDAALMANLGRFHTLLIDYEIANRIGGRPLIWEKDALKGLCWYLNAYATKAYDEQIPENAYQVDAVQVTTVHQAKGLEWPVVFLFSTVDSRFPSSRVGEQKSWCGIPRKLFDAERYEGTEEDEKRLFYVAITRARDLLVISYFEKKKNKMIPSRFIDSLDKGAILHLDENQDLPQISIHSKIIDEELQTYSSTEILTYSICPYMYRLAEVWGFKPPITEMMGFGNSIHECMRRAGEYVKKGFSPISAVATAVDEHFYLPFASGEILDNAKRGAKEMLLNFVKNNSDDLRRIEEVEYRVEFPVQKATITGKVDVILKAENMQEVREYKTSETVRSFEEVAFQVQLYAHALRLQGRPIGAGSVVFFDSGGSDKMVGEVDVGKDAILRAINSAEAIIKKIKEGSYTPNPKQESCVRCDHKPLCKFYLKEVNKNGR
ncbi:MAG: ATP-dependent DNA helicase [Candidatus Micrarchaeia archaeon]